MKVLLITGQSGSGKSYHAQNLKNCEDLSVNIIKSYTTRPKRTPEDTEYNFVDDDVYEQLKDGNLIIQEFISKENYKYFSVIDSFVFSDDVANVLIVTPKSVKVIHDYLTRENIPFTILHMHFVLSESTRREFMKKRGDTLEQIESRLQTVDKQIEEEFQEHLRVLPELENVVTTIFNPVKTKVEV